MNLFAKKYAIAGWNCVYVLTAKQLYERIMFESSKSNYNWTASAHELVRVISSPDFPEKYAFEIKLAILNCFSQLELQKEFPGYGTEKDNEAVAFCYNSLTSTDYKTSMIKRTYLIAIIKSVIKYHFGFLNFHHYGPTYRKLCEEWENAKFQKYCFKKQVDFDELRKELHEDFDKTMKTAEAEGRFKEDDEKHLEESKKFWSSLNLKDI